MYSVCYMKYCPKHDDFMKQSPNQQQVLQVVLSVRNVSQNVSNSGSDGQQVHIQKTKHTQ